MVQSGGFHQHRCAAVRQLRRNNLIGPRQVNFDFSVIKDFHLTERHILQFRTEMFNAVNHVELGNPATGWGSSNVLPQATFVRLPQPGKHAPDSICPQVQLLTTGKEPMQLVIEKLLNDFERGGLTRRQVAALSQRWYPAPHSCA